MKIFTYIFYVLILAAGVAVGGFLFSDTARRPVVDVDRCHETCFKASELAGLLASVGIKVAGGNLPTVIFETDKTLVFDIQYPYPPSKIHYAVVPKKDIKDTNHLTREDGEYIADAYLVMSKIVSEHDYKKYRVITNGPGFQEVAYLHFHLVIDRPEKQSGFSAKVAKVVDGDTVQLADGRYLRYIGIDAPEKADDKNSAQCFAKEATERNRELVEGQEITFYRDISEKDDYGRQLGFAYLADGAFVNEKLVAEGYAFAYPYQPDISKQQQFAVAEGSAFQKKLGLWQACAVTTLKNGKRQTGGAQ